MKHLLRYIPLLFISFLTYCTTTEEGLDRAEVMQLSTSSIEAGALGGENTFYITSRCAWEAKTSYESDDTGWIELSDDADEGSTEITVTLSENTSAKDRYATIEVGNARYNLASSIRVHQKAGEPFINLDNSNKEVDTDGGKVDIIVTSNIDYTITTRDSWIHPSTDSGVKGEQKIMITVNENTAEEPRTATVTFSNKEYNISAVYTITQQKFEPIIVVDAKNIACSANGSTKIVAIDGNISWSASCDADWVNITPTKGEKGSSTLKVVVAENTKTTARETVIKICNTEYEVEKQITISQEAWSPVLNLSTESISTPYTGATESITIEGYISWEASCDADWVTITPTKGNKGSSTLKIDVAANTKKVARDAVVTISNAVYDVEKQIAISQEAVPNNVILYTSSDEKVVEPNETNAFGASIVSNTYKNGQGIMLFNAPVTSIGDSAFFLCSSLTSVTIPDSVTTIEDSAFCRCYKLTSVTIPDSVTKIGDYTFYRCTSLTSVTIPDSVTKIGDAAFNYCTSLTSFYGKFASEDNRCLIVDGKLIAFAPAGLTEYTIPDSVTSIGTRAFSDCDSLTSVTIPDSVTSIGGYAFNNCTSLTSVTIPDSVTKIGDAAFNYCTSLTSVTIPDSVTKIGGYAFDCCTSLESFYGKFASEDNRCLIVDGKLIAFAPVGLTEYTIPDSVTSIGTRAFAGCDSLTSVTIPDSITSIGDYAFAYCTSLTSVIIPDSVTKIGDAAFAYCTSLTSVTIPDSVTSIGDNAFDSCESLTSVTIPDSVTKIGHRAFYDCTSLTSVYCKAATPPAGGYYMFESNALGRKIYVPTASVEAYKSAAYWSDYAGYIVGYEF